jgi:hypothetical protein
MSKDCNVCPLGVQRPPKISLTGEASFDQRNVGKVAAKSVAEVGRKQNESERVWDRS